MGHLNLRAIDLAYKMPETGKAAKETKPASDDFKKMIQEKQESEPKAAGREPDSKEQPEEPVEEVQNDSTAETAMYGMLQMNPLQQSIQIFDAEAAQGSQEAELVLEGTAELLPQGEQTVALPEEVLTEEQPEANEQVMTSNQKGPLASEVREKPERTLTSETIANQKEPLASEVREKPERTLTSETIANQKEPLASEVREKPERTLTSETIANQKESSVSEVREEPERTLTSETIVGQKEPLASEVLTEQKGKTAAKAANEEVRSPEDVSAQTQEAAFNAAGVQQTAISQTGTEKAAMAQEQPVTTMYVKQPEEIPQKLTDELLVKTAHGVKEFEIHVEPVNLGKIAIKILYEQGQTTISILCSEKKTMELVGQNARQIGAVMEENLGGPTTIILDKQETDYLNQERNDNEQAGREAEQERQREESKKHKAQNPEEFLQKLRLGLAV